jgi:hypothetical protein
VVVGAFVWWGDMRESRHGGYEIGDPFPYMDGWMMISYL